jgi:prophage antirepressor-like protein
MTSLVQWFNKSSEYEIDGKKLAIKIVGTSEKPWFKADDVCKALGYKYTANALNTHVKGQYKSVLNDLIGLYKSSNPKIDPRYEGQQPYITEAGLYSLIFASKLPTADAFRTWVFEDVLPSIRKDGHYELTQSLEASKAQLALKEKTEREIMLQLDTERKAKEAAELAKETAEKEREKARAKLRSETQRYRNHIKKALEFNQATKKVEPLEYVYVATTDRYQDHHKFKIGGTATFELLKSRLNQYNSGESDSDSHYYVYTRKTVNYKAIEHTVQGLLSGFRENQSKELYIIHYDWLIKCLDAILDGNVELALFINSSRDRMVQDTITKSPTIASPIQLETIIYSRAGDDPHDVTALLAPELIETIKTAIDSYAPDNNTIKRKEFEQRLLELDPDLRLEGKRKTAWNVVRQLGSLTNPMWRYKY